ncbi:MAG: ice-binding family protein [Bacteriovorax sp.]|nr:ice-binding family protein [Bacteriovorax sp.]
MNKLLLLFSTFISLGLIFTPGCGKKIMSSNSEEVTVGSAVEVVPVPNHKVKALDLGIANSFAVMAYTSITSAPTSNINGKVGLKPGVRSLVTLNPRTEVSGGLSEIYAGDDVGDPLDYLNIAREDLIAAYRDAVARVTDKDKVEAYRGMPGGKILPPGIYRWSNGVVISSDMTLEGNDTDVFIFQISGDMSVSAKVRISLSGGVQAKNIFWQVSGKVTLESVSVVPGNIMSQLTFEMKSLAELHGRALVKNGKLIMNQNVINRPSL